MLSWRFRFYSGDVDGVGGGVCGGVGGGGGGGVNRGGKSSELEIQVLNTSQRLPLIVYLTEAQCERPSTHSHCVNLNWNWNLRVG